jgi:hypothetical protein
MDSQQLLQITKGLYTNKKINLSQKFGIKKLIFKNDFRLIPILKHFEKHHEEDELAEDLIICIEQEEAKKEEEGYIEEERTSYLFRWVLEMIERGLNALMTKKRKYLFAKWLAVGLEDAIVDTVRFRIIDALFVAILVAFYRRFSMFQPYLEWLVDY